MLKNIEALAHGLDEKRLKEAEAKREVFRANLLASTASGETEKARDELDFAVWTEKYLRGLYEEWKRAQTTQESP